MGKGTKYSGPLSERALLVAKNELREDDTAREQCLEQIRNWIAKNPKIIHCRTDDSFLLRFLRFKKFSVPMAQEALERYLLLRQSLSRAFHNLDWHLPRMAFLINNGCAFPTPGRDRNGRRWIIGRPEVFDPHKFTNEDMLRLAGIIFETLVEDEENQVMGLEYYGDGGTVTFPYLTLFTPKEAVRLVKNGELTVPMRHKAFHIMNVPASLKFAVDWGMSLISEKSKSRVKFYVSLEEAVKQNHFDPYMLPKEFGGTIPMSEMIESFKKELETARPTLLMHDDMKVRMELFSTAAKEGAVSALKNTCNPFNSDFLSGSFRKLEVD